MYSIYENKVLEKLSRLEKKRVGTIFELCKTEFGPIYGFIKGKKPKLLLTSCQHANELYGTYRTLLEYAEHGNKDAIIIPVVDVANFCSNINSLNILKNEKGNEFPYFVYVSLTFPEYTTIAKKPYSFFGEENPPKEVKALEDLIKDNLSISCVIDFHNSSLCNYIFVSAMEKDKIKKIDKPLRKVMKKGRFKIDQLPFILGLEKVNDGFFQIWLLGKKTLINYAQKCGIKNLAIEVPPFKSKYPFRFWKEEQLIKTNIEIIEKFSSL